MFIRGLGLVLHFWSRDIHRHGKVCYSAPPTNKPGPNSSKEHRQLPEGPIRGSENWGSSPVATPVRVSWYCHGRGRYYRSNALRNKSAERDLNIDWKALFDRGERGSGRGIPDEPFQKGLTATDVYCVACFGTNLRIFSHPPIQPTDASNNEDLLHWYPPSTGSRAYENFHL